MSGLPLNSQFLIALDYELDAAKEIAIVGSEDHSETQKMLQYLRGEFFPNTVVALGTPERSSSLIPLLQGKTQMKGKPTAYVCMEKVCRYPVNLLEDLQKEVRAGEHKLQL